ncbi:Las1-like-domain-containing protein [Mrakia frigida]|uniref:rRNA-processing protein LAS1 n=1 Tax=Mrakia frigida TaxID=29902 RepID=UPI003FCBF9A2
MQLPRKVPWKNRDELAQVSSWIFNDSNDFEARKRAVKRLKTWLYAHPSSHPVALSATLNLLSSLLLEASSSPTDPHATRLSLSLSLVRFVNSLVDPLQTGQFARPIAMIAAELGIPGWLVELRHAGTHEGLPSVEVLREGAEEALNYLHLAFFLPTLNPQSTSSLLHPQTSDPTSSSSFQGHLSLLPPLLKSYKLLSKSLTKDHSLPSLSLRAVKKDLSGWLDTAERATGSTGDGVRAFVGVLVGGDEELGVLVPVSKKKRSIFTASSPHPPPPLLSLYSPILKSLSKAHPSLPSTLANTILSVIVSQDSEITPQSDSAAETLSSWLVWVFDELLVEGGEEREELISKAIKGVWDNTRAVQLLQVVASRHPAFEARLRPVLSVVDPDHVRTLSS